MTAWHTHSLSRGMRPRDAKRWKGQSAAQRELGAADYNELSRLADSSAAIKNVVIDHGIKRMIGKNNGITWKQVLTLARQFARA